MNVRTLLGITSFFLAIIYALNVVSCGKSAPTAPVAPTPTPAPYSVPVTIQASLTYTAGYFDIYDYDAGNTLSQHVTISGVAISPSSTVTIMNFQSDHMVQVFLIQDHVTCPPGLGTWGTNMTVGTPSGSVTSTGNSVIACYEGYGYMQEESEISGKMSGPMTVVY